MQSQFHCEGWWEQSGLGRQHMQCVELSFDGSRVVGSGIDVVGEFVIDGVLKQAGEVELTKKYIGKHRVQYLGRYDGEGTMYGAWSLGLSRGPWLLQLRRGNTNRTTKIVEFAGV